MRRITFVLIAVLGASCAITTAPFPITYQLIDLPDDRRIELRYRNDRSEMVCLAPEFWPNQAGKIDVASRVVFLVVGDRRFPIEEFNTGYCPEDCALRVRPGETVTASIPYESFGVPDALVNEKKRLEFTPMAYHCRRR